MILHCSVWSHLYLVECLDLRGTSSQSPSSYRKTAGSMSRTPSAPTRRHRLRLAGRRLGHPTASLMWMDSRPGVCSCCRETCHRLHRGQYCALDYAMWEGVPVFENESKVMVDTLEGDMIIDRREAGAFWRGEKEETPAQRGLKDIDTVYKSRADRMPTADVRCAWLLLLAAISLPRANGFWWGSWVRGQPPRLSARCGGRLLQIANAPDGRLDGPAKYQLKNPLS